MNQRSFQLFSVWQDPVVWLLIGGVIGVVLHWIVLRLSATSSQKDEVGSTQKNTDSVAVARVLYPAWLLWQQHMIWMEEILICEEEQDGMWLIDEVIFPNLSAIADLFVKHADLIIHQPWNGVAKDFLQYLALLRFRCQISPDSDATWELLRQLPPSFLRCLREHIAQTNV